MKQQISLLGLDRRLLRRAGAILALAALLALILFSAQPAPRAQAATCATQANGDWGSLSTWACGFVPSGATYDVTISHAVTISNNRDIGGVTILSGGSLTVSGNFTLMVSGDFDVNGGTFTPGTGTVDIHSSSDQSILTHGAWVQFYTLTKSANYMGAILIDPTAGGIQILHSLGGNNAAPDNYVKLFSTQPGTQWQVQLLGAGSVDYVSVQDSNNSGASQIIPVHNGVFHRPINTTTGTGNNTHWTLAAPTPTVINLYSYTNPGHPNQQVTFRTKTFNASGTTNLAYRPTGNMAFYTVVSNNLTLVVGCESIPATPYPGLPPFPPPVPPPSLPANAPYSETPCQTTFPALGNLTIRAVFTGTGVYADSTSEDYVEAIMIPMYLPLVTR